ncbi:hypothetical protein [Pseudomonas sp. PA1(2017)]|uniref:YobI family P-loop NTPase n=1 Tax=Pseudomonas sp. PA1(2017) TaxID=1932113 RepID=UPI0011153F75|nr:hypothetical protein [Pseudomonas sp. PA1(2017)]
MKYFGQVLHKLCSTKAAKRIFWYLKPEQPSNDRFLDLAPVDNADRDGLYRKALDFAMQNAAIRNIALTGPYGSGKTSVIKTYEKNTHYRFLNVSLATFSDPNLDKSKDEPPADEAIVKIERSILQQMLYGTDSGTLPYSRFKRISKPQWLSANAIGFTGWIVACGFLYREKDKLLAAQSIAAIDPLWMFVFLYVIAFFAQIISRAHKATHSLSVKRFSLQNGEVELDSTPESSILNKHLDEIIYFFEENKYDAVVFEDLDRFGSPEIFIKLREINKIINDRPKRRSLLHKLKIAQPLKFLYAIKDDVFLNKDRAKFFDFITPIIPIINNSNSREMFAKCISAREEAGDDISSRFLSEVSLYLDDFRLIKNISNEFLIYRGKVGGEPNLEKLLSMIVYKNTYPKDFEQLHHGKGALYSIVEQRTAVISRAATLIDEEIDRLKELIKASENEVGAACEDLARIFWGHLCGNHREHWITGIYSGDVVVSFEELLIWQNFRKLFIEKNIRVQKKVYSTRFHQTSLQETATDRSFREIEEAISPGVRFDARYESIKNKELKRRDKLLAEIDALKWKKAELARKPLRELIESAEVGVAALAVEHGVDDSRLLNYLIKNGYLDENYHLYISIFHEGRMSRNDWNFIQTIRDFRSLEPDTRIDTPLEVISEMREEDFGAEYVLNVILVDHLLSTIDMHNSKLQSAITYISQNFVRSEGFFSAYWISGRAVDKLTEALATTWPHYAVTALDSDQAAKHVARILAYVSPSYIAEHMNLASSLSRYLAKNAQLVFSENIRFVNGYLALDLMSVKIADMRAIEAIPELLSHIYENCLYSLSSATVDFSLKRYPGSNGDQATGPIDSGRANYTAIKAHASSPLLKYVDSNIDYYLEEVALALEENVSESEQSILEIMNHPNVDSDLATQFALKQNHIFNNFSNIPDYMWGALFFNGHIDMNWDNVLNYFSHEEAEHDRLIEHLGSDDVATDLSKSKIPTQAGDRSILNSLCWLIISNASISRSSLEKLCASVPLHYKNFPDSQSIERRIILANCKVVRLNGESFSSASESIALRAALIRNNFELFLEETEIYPVGIDVKILVLSALNENQKCALVKKISLEEIQSDASALRGVATFFSHPTIVVEDFNMEIVRYCLSKVAVDGVGMGILMNFVSNFSDEEIVAVLKAAPEPYCNFVKPNVRQKIERSERHLGFVRELDRRGIVSSITDDKITIRVNTYKKGLLKFFTGSE